PTLLPAILILLMIPSIVIISPSSTLSLLTCLPTPTPFPYTTLFRSGFITIAPILTGDGGGPHLFGNAYLPAIHQGMAIGPGRGGVRKSTRLNSSHGSISYAVFCLKKKTCCIVSIRLLDILCNADHVP